MADIFSTAIVGGIIYDIVKSGVQKLTKEKLIVPLKKWCSDITAFELAEALEKVQVDEFMSERAIELELQKSKKIIELIASVKPTQTENTITQNNYGAGHNISNTGPGSISVGSIIEKK